MQYIELELSNKSLFVYKLSNSDFCDPIPWRGNGQNHLKWPHRPLKINTNDVFSAEQRRHLMDFELTKHRGLCVYGGGAMHDISRYRGEEVKWTQCQGKVKKQIFQRTEIWDRFSPCAKHRDEQWWSYS
jgi:hypothetical protein